jgi:pimeloyl-ACP methyl ester carboxylesterase
MTSKHSVIFLHGTLGSSWDLKPLIEYFSSKDFKVYSFDFSGHGLSAQDTKEFRIDLFAKDLDQFIRKNNLTSPIVFGYSMGGYVALYHTANYDDSPIKIVFTYGTRFNWSEKSVQKEIPSLNPVNIIEKYPQTAELLRKKHGEQWGHLLRSTAHMMQHLEKLDGLTKEDMSEITIPVILMIGDQDRVITSEETHLTKSWLRNGIVKTISHSKHELERSNLKEIASTIIENIEKF